MYIKLLALGLIGTFLAVLVKKYNKELLPFFEISAVIVAILIIKSYTENQAGALKSLFSLYSQGSELYSCLFKGAAITVLSKLASEVCRESGNPLMAEIIELGGRIMLIALSLPYVTQVAETALSFVE